MKKSVANQVIGAQMIAAADGTAFTGAVTVYVTGDGGVQAIGSVGAGACTHEGNGFHTYAPAQAETNYDHVAFTFIGTGAIPATIQGYTVFPQTGDTYARLGAPAGASVSADVAAMKVDTAAILVDTAVIGAAGAGLTALATQASVNTIDDLLDTEVAAIKAETASIQADTNDIQTRLPAALIGGRMDSTLSAIDNSTTALAAFKRAVKGNVIGTVGAGSTTTSIVTSLVTPAPSVADQLKGLVIKFADDTTTAALRGQATTITASSASATPTLTVTALTTAAVAGDTFAIL